MKKLVRNVYHLILATVFVVVALFALLTLLPDLLGAGCTTQLCCVDCDTVPVSRIIDGDTFVSREERVRPFGYDAPEVGERCAAEATERLRELAGDTVRLEPGPRARDRFDRRLGYAYTKSGESIDEIILREGLAVAWREDGQHRDLLVGVETEARSKGVGCLW